VDSVLKGKTEYPIIHPEKKQKKGAKYENSGIFVFSNASLTSLENFVRIKCNKQ
jgi:hypothetical protein